MSRETVEEKGRRYLIEGRLTVALFDADDARLHADVVGSDGTVYQVGTSPHGWFCTCPAYGRCCHVAAVELIAPKDQPVPETVWRRIDAAADCAAVDDALAARPATTGQRP